MDAWNLPLLNLQRGDGTGRLQDGGINDASDVYLEGRNRANSVKAVGGGWQIAGIASTHVRPVSVSQVLANTAFQQTFPRETAAAAMQWQRVC